MFWSMASLTQDLSKQSDFHFIMRAVTTSRKHVLRMKLDKMWVICSLSSKALKNNLCFAGCPANGSWGGSSVQLHRNHSPFKYTVMAFWGSAGCVPLYMNSLWVTSWLFSPCRRCFLLNSDHWEVGLFLFLQKWLQWISFSEEDPESLCVWVLFASTLKFSLILLIYRSLYLHFCW